MKIIAMFIIVILLIGCGDKEVKPKKLPHTLVIIETYLEDIKANDGNLVQKWMTVASLENGSRTIMVGKYGSPQDTLYEMYLKTLSTSYYGCDYWTWKQ